MALLHDHRGTPIERHLAASMVSEVAIYDPGVVDSLIFLPIDDLADPQEHLIALAKELQPVERVWPLVDAGVVNGQVQTEEELWERVEVRCAYLQTQHPLIRSYTLFHWWPGGC